MIKLSLLKHNLILTPFFQIPKRKIPFKHKSDADDYYKQSEYNIAIKLYSEAILAIRMLISEGIIDLETLNTEYLKQLILPCNLNMALCFLKINQYQKCVKMCDDALKIDEKNVKALLRKGKALEMLQDVNYFIFNYFLV